MAYLPFRGMWKAIGGTKGLGVGAVYGGYKGLEHAESIMDQENEALVPLAGKVAMASAVALPLMAGAALGTLGGVSSLVTGGRYGEGATKLAAASIAAPIKVAARGARVAGRVAKTFALGDQQLMAMAEGTAQVRGVVGFSAKLGNSVAKRANGIGRGFDSILGREPPVPVPGQGFLAELRSKNPIAANFGNGTFTGRHLRKKTLDSSPALFGGMTVGIAAIAGAPISEGLKNANDTPPGGVGQIRRRGAPDFNHAGVGLKAHYNRH